MADKSPASDGRNRSAMNALFDIETMVDTIVAHGREWLSNSQEAFLAKNPDVLREVNALVETRQKRAHPETYALAHDSDAGDGADPAHADVDDGAKLAVPEASNGVKPRLERIPQTIQTTSTTRTTRTRTTRTTRLKVADETRVTSLKTAN